MRRYWIAWGVLLAFTLIMLWMDGARWPRTTFAVAMLTAMLAKASIIGANFMHLRRERLSLALTVVVGLLVTGTILFVLIAPDAVRIRRMAETSGQAPSR